MSGGTRDSGRNGCEMTSDLRGKGTDWGESAFFEGPFQKDWTDFADKKEKTDGDGETDRQGGRNRLMGRVF